MFHSKELQDHGVIKTEEGIFLPRDFCLVDILKWFEDPDHPFTEEQQQSIQVVLLGIEFEFGLCSGSIEGAKGHKQLIEDSKTNVLCTGCGKRGMERIIQPYHTTRSVIEVSISEVPTLRCLHCGETYYEHESMLLIEQEEKRIKEEAHGDYYEIVSYPDQVELRSMNRLVFEPRGWKLLMRDELRQSIKHMYLDDATELYAMYEAGDTDTFDLENVLFYNVGSGAFQGLKPERLVFERSYAKPEPARTGRAYPSFHLYRFPLPEAYIWEQGEMISCWQAACPPLKGEVKPEHIWRLMTQGARITDMHPSPSDQLGIKIQIHVPTNRDLTLLTHIKALIDGIVAAFHKHDGTEIDRVLERLSLSLREDAELLRPALIDGTHAPLGTTNLLQPYRSGVKWNPADHRFVHVEIRIVQAIDDEWSHSGEIFVVSQVVEDHACRMNISKSFYGRGFEIE
jgi:hypothetical protein